MLLGLLEELDRASGHQQQRPETKWWRWHQSNHILACHSLIHSLTLSFSHSLPFSLRHIHAHMRPHAHIAWGYPWRGHRFTGTLCLLCQMLSREALQEQYWHLQPLLHSMKIHCWLSLLFCTYHLPSFLQPTPFILPQLLQPFPEPGELEDAANSLWIWL